MTKLNILYSFKIFLNIVHRRNTYMLFKKITKKIRELRKVSWIKFIYYNYLCSVVIRSKGCFIVPYKNSQIEIERSAKLILKGTLYTNYNKVLGSRSECYLRLRENATFTVNGKFYTYSNTTIEVHKDAELYVGSAYINSGTVIICAKKISIGNGVIIARDVYIYDSDHHNIVDSDGKIKNHSADVVIEDNVWIGLRATILKGTTIISGSVIGASTLVSKKEVSGLVVSDRDLRPHKDIIWQG